MHIKTWPVNIVEDWLLTNLGDPVHVSRGKNGREYCYNESIINQDVDDNKARLYINVDHKPGMWIGYKSGTHGDFIRLVCKYTGKNKSAAFKEIMTTYLEEFTNPESFKNAIGVRDYDDKDSVKLKIPQDIAEAEVRFPEKTYNIELNDEVSVRYYNYLKSRKCPDDLILKCKFSFAKKYIKNNEEIDYIDFKNYVIIPFYDRFGKTIYWQARSIYNNVKPAYYNIDNAANYVYNLYTEADEIVICEGIFDAVRFGINGVSTGGKDLKDQQVSKICSMNFKEIIIGGNLEKFDIGPKAMIKNYLILKERGQNVKIFNWVNFCRKHNIKVHKKMDFGDLEIENLSIDIIKDFLIDNHQYAEFIYKTYRFGE